MLRLERSRAAGKDFLVTGLGTQPSNHWVPDHRKKKWAGGSQAPRTLRKLGSQPASSFEAVKLETPLAPALLEGFSPKPLAAPEQIISQG